MPWGPVNRAQGARPLRHLNTSLAADFPLSLGDELSTVRSGGMDGEPFWMDDGEPNLSVLGAGDEESVY